MGYGRYGYGFGIAGGCHHHLSFLICPSALTRGESTSTRANQTAWPTDLALSVSVSVDGPKGNTDAAAACLSPMTELLSFRDDTAHFK